jgi:hypothetical protein
MFTQMLIVIIFTSDKCWMTDQRVLEENAVKSHHAHHPWNFLSPSQYSDSFKILLYLLGKDSSNKTNFLLCNETSGRSEMSPKLNPLTAIPCHRTTYWEHQGYFRVNAVGTQKSTIFLSLFSSGHSYSNCESLLFHLNNTVSHLMSSIDRNAVLSHYHRASLFSCGSFNASVSSHLDQLKACIGSKTEDVIRCCLVRATRHFREWWQISMEQWWNDESKENLKKVKTCVNQNNFSQNSQGNWNWVCMTRKLHMLLLS